MPLRPGSPPTMKGQRSATFRRVGMGVGPTMEEIEEHLAKARTSLDPKITNRSKVGLLAVSTYPPRQCGIATYSEMLYNAMGGHYRPIYLVALADKEREVHMHGPLRIFPTPAVTDEDGYVKLYLRILQVSPKVIHFQHEYGILGEIGFIALLRRLQLDGFKIVVTLHTVIHFDREMQIVKASDRVIVHNKPQLDQIKWAGESKIHIIHHGTRWYDLRERQRAREKLGIPDDKLVILTTGFMDMEMKGFDTFVSAASHIKQFHDNFQMVLISGAHPGSPVRQNAMADQLERMILTGGVADVVDFRRGFADENVIFDYLAACDIVCFPYRFIGSFCTSGIVHLFMAAGRPMICSKVPQFDELGDGENCIKIDNSDPRLLAEAVKKIVDDPDMAGTIGNNLRAYARAVSWDNTSRMHIDIYEGLGLDVSGEEAEVLGELQDVSRLTEIGPDYYDADYFDRGDKAYDQDGEKKKWGYTGDRWDDGWDWVLKGLKGVIGDFKTLYDIGAGKGSWIDFCVRNGIEAEGSDFSPYAVSHPTGQARYHLWLKSAGNLKGVPSAHFDLVTANDLFEHIYETDADEAVAEFRRIAKKWAFALIATLTPDGPVKEFTMEAGKPIPKELEVLAVAGHVNVRLRSYWITKFKDVGFKVRDDLRDRFLDIIGDNIPNWLKHYLFFLEVEHEKASVP